LHFSEYGDAAHYGEELSQARARLRRIDDTPQD